MTQSPKILDRHGVAEVLAKAKAGIIQDWEALARERVDAAKSQSQFALRNSLPEFLDQLVETLKAKDPNTETEINAEVARNHGETRSQQSEYTLGEVIVEYQILRTVVIDCLESDKPTDRESRQIVNVFIDQGISKAATKYAELDKQKQIERSKKYDELRLEAEKANQAKSAFLANMSHEIRTPIGAITGFAEMLNRPGNSEAEKQNFALIIERNSKHLLRLIDDILDLSKVEAGKIALENSNFNLNEFLTDFDALMSLKAAEKGIRFVMNVKTTIPDEVCGDPLRLKQILLNVVGNAVKFTGKGKVTTDFDYKDEFLKIAVTDTGIGIAEENIGNLFKAFSQADPSLTRKFGGTGLGLILSKRLANHLGGDLVLASSEPGKGSQFVITVNLKPSAEAKMVDFIDAPSAEILVTPSPNERGILKGTTVLLVEDSSDNRALISVYLKNTGVKLITARDGLDGCRLAMKNLPDIVLMDIQMPRMDGHEATRKLRAAGFSNPIVAFTAHAMRDERDLCFESGFTDYLTKPLQRELLIATISRHTKASEILSN